MSNYKLADKRFKTEIKRIEEPIHVLNKIRGYTFEWNETRQSEYQGKDIGFIAQEVMSVIPSSVKKEDKKLLVDSLQLLPYLLESVHELAERTEELEGHVKTLQTELDSIKTFYKIKDEEL